MITDIKSLKNLTHIELKKAYDEWIAGDKNNYDQFFHAIGKLDPKVREIMQKLWDEETKNTSPSEPINWSKLGDSSLFFAYLKDMGMEIKR